MKMNNKGISFVELMMAAAISGGLIFAAVDFFQRIDKDTAKTQHTLESTLDRLSFEHRMRSDLFETKYSFNSLNVLDDDGENFFKFMQNGVCDTKCTRTLTINKKSSVGDSDASIFFLIKDNTDSVEQIFNPINAYEVVSVDSRNDNNLVFNSFNQGGTLAKSIYTPWHLTPSLPARLILVYSPDLVYQQNADVSREPGRMLKFLGWLDQSNFEGKLKPEVVSFNSRNVFDNINPITGNQINSEDALLKGIPFNSGLGMFVLIAPVKMIKYKIRTFEEGGRLIGKLFREDLTRQGHFEEFMISNDVEKITFKRSNIGNATVEMQIEYPKAKK